MSKVLVEESNLTAIASAIRQKLGVQTTYKPGQMATAIGTIHGEPVLETLSATANGSYSPSTGKDGFSQVTVNVPNTYAAGDEGKVVSSGALVAQTARASEITANGTYDTTENNSVTVNVSGGGESTQLELYELYGATFDGYTQTFEGFMNNKYIACCFHDNMYSTYQLNGITESFPESVQGKNGGIIYGVTKEVTNNADHTVNAIRKKGSQFISSHYDLGSYMSVVGGWVGYPSGGSIYQNAESNTATNSITLNSAHNKLLIFIAGSNVGMNNVTTVDINGVSYSVTNMGARYDAVYSVYAAIEIDNNLDTTITITFPVACYNYVSIIGFD